MQMWMQAQLLSPSVQNRYHAHLYFFGFAKGLQGVPCRFKQSIIHYFRLMHRQGIDTTRQGKNYVTLAKRYHEIL